MKQESKDWLEANKDIWERQQVGNDKHLNDREAKQLQAIAKEIDKDRYFTIYGCRDCIRELIKFVYAAAEPKIIRKATFPKIENDKIK